MKTSVYVRLLALASVAMAPLAAVAQESNVAQACVSAFVAQNFPGQSPIIRVANEDAVRRPLLLSSGTISMKLSAASNETGRVLATATCTKRRGVVTLTTDDSRQLVASR